MKSPIARLASVAAVIAVAGLSMTLWVKLSTPAYALDQTVEALKNVRFLHIIGRDETGQTNDERWIEIGMDGWQVRYRQDNSANLFVIEDGQSTARYRHDKKAVVIYDRDDLQYQWVGPLGEAFENLRQEGKILEEDADYQGRPAHKVWWPAMHGECYVDPGTKLPIAIGKGKTELSYEEPPAGIFEVTIPEGYAVVDKRPGATTPIPPWLLEEESIQEESRAAFGRATDALARGDYAEAAEQFEYAVAHSPERNWAWFWLGSAYHGLGQYELAVEKFTKVLETFGDEPCCYCNYARALANAHLGADEAAAYDLRVCLPAMVRTLRIPSAGEMFEYADNPMIRYGRYHPSEREIVAKMINRLRIVSGQNFGYDPAATAEENEVAITAWEQWLQTDGQIKFTPDAELLEVSAAGDAGK